MVHPERCYKALSACHADPGMSGPMPSTLPSPSDLSMFAPSPRWEAVVQRLEGKGQAGSRHSGWRDWGLPNKGPMWLKYKCTDSSREGGKNTP